MDSSGTAVSGIVTVLAGAIAVLSVTFSSSDGMRMVGLTTVGVVVILSVVASSLLAV